MSFVRIYVHAVWAVKHRAALLDDAWRGDVHDFIARCMSSRGHQPLEINSVDDHLHAFFQFSAHEDISALMRHIKGSSSRMINENGLTGRDLFRWQGGYGAFSVSHTVKERVRGYVRRQRQIHRRRALAFLDEYDDLIARHEPDPEDIHWFDPLV